MLHWLRVRPAECATLHPQNLAATLIERLLYSSQKYFNAHSQRLPPQITPGAVIHGRSARPLERTHLVPPGVALRRPTVSPCIFEVYSLLERPGGVIREIVVSGFAFRRQNTGASAEGLVPCWHARSGSSRCSVVVRPNSREPRCIEGPCLFPPGAEGVRRVRFPGAPDHRRHLCAASRQQLRVTPSCPLRLLVRVVLDWSGRHGFRCG